MKKKNYCKECHCELSNILRINYDLLGNPICHSCAEKGNFKAQANENCHRCHGEGYIIAKQYQTYPLEHYSERKERCDCFLTATKEVTPVAI